MNSFRWRRINSELEHLIDDDKNDYKILDCGSDEDMCFYNCVCKALENHNKYNSLFPVFLEQMVNDEISESEFYQAFKENNETGVGQLEIMITSKILNCIFNVYIETGNGIIIEKIWDKENISTPEFIIELYLENISSHFYLLGRRNKIIRTGKPDTFFSLLI